MSPAGLSTALGLLFSLSLFGLPVFGLPGGPRVAAGQDAGTGPLIRHGQEAGADAEQMRLLARRARQADLSSEATSSLLRPAVALAEQGLRAGPLLSKALEGLAKQVPPARLRPVLQQQRAHTEQAGRLVNQWARRPEASRLLGAPGNAPESGGQRKARAKLITVVAEAPQQGVPIDKVEDFVIGLPGNVDRRPVPLAEVATAVGVLPDLIRKGTSPETARQLLTAALGTGYSAESLRQLPAALQSARRESRRPVGAVAQGAAKAIARGTPAATVLQSLFQGRGPGIGPPRSAPGAGTPPGVGLPDIGLPDIGPPDTGPPEDTGPTGGEGPS